MCVAADMCRFTVSSFSSDEPKKHDRNLRQEYTGISGKTPTSTNPKYCTVSCTKKNLLLSHLSPFAHGCAQSFKYLTAVLGPASCKKIATG